VFIADLKPINKCILTDLLPTPKYPEYTSGLLLSIANVNSDFDISCSILNTGMQGKYVNKPSIIKIRVPPIVCTSLIASGVYAKCSGFLIVDNSLRSYVDLSNIDFLNEAYARIFTVNKLANNWFRANVLINNNVEIRKFYTIYNEANKITNKSLDTLVNSDEKRNRLIYNVLLMESFIKKYLPGSLNMENFLRKTLMIAEDCQQPDVTKKITTILSSKKGMKSLNDLQEIKDVLHRYKNSGSWL